MTGVTSHRPRPLYGDMRTARGGSPVLLSKRLYSHAHDRVWREHQRGPPAEATMSICFFRKPVGPYRRHLLGTLGMEFRALMSRLISLVGVKWSCLRINKPAFPPFPGPNGLWFPIISGRIRMDGQQPAGEKECTVHPRPHMLPPAM